LLDVELIKARAAFFIAGYNEEVFSLKPWQKIWCRFVPSHSKKDAKVA